jgi:hypothetical protein
MIDRFAPPITETETKTKEFPFFELPTEDWQQ